MANAIQILLNEAIKLERTEYLGVRPYERSSERQTHANGFKDKTVSSRLGKLELRVPQTRDSQFYPSARERGERSERALKLAVTEMYVQGVSEASLLRLVTAVLVELSEDWETGMRYLSVDWTRPFSVSLVPFPFPVSLPSVYLQSSR